MSDWVVALISVGGSAVVTTAVGFIVKKWLTAYTEKRDAEKIELEKAREEKKKKERIDDMKAIIKPLDDKLGLLSNGTLSTLRNDILTCYYKCLEKGYRNDYDYVNIHDLFEAYEALDGNSFVRDIMNRFDELPTKEEIRKKQK